VPGRVHVRARVQPELDARDVGGAAFGHPVHGLEAPEILAGPGGQAVAERDADIDDLHAEEVSDARGVGDSVTPALTGAAHAASPPGGTCPHTARPQGSRALRVG